MEFADLKTLNDMVQAELDRRGPTFPKLIEALNCRRYSITETLMRSQFPMEIHHILTPEGLMVQLTLGLAEFIENGELGVEIMERFAVAIGCQPREDGFHGPGSLFQLSKEGDKVFAKGIVVVSENSKEIN